MAAEDDIQRPRATDGGCRHRGLGETAVQIADRRIFWGDKRVVVTGGAGFLGSFVVERLRELGCRDICVPRSCTYDLRDRDAIIALYSEARPHIVIHLAAIVGGIGANRQNPGRFFYDNAIMGIQLVEYARQFDVRKLVIVGTVCSYPKFTPVPFREDDLWSGYPEETNAPYGLAKKMLLVQAQAYREQYGLNAIYLLPGNLYGPRDNFDLQTSHVIPAIIRKCMEAVEKGLSEVILWGDGSATREFLYVEDAAEGILLGTERYEGMAPANLGTGEEITIRDLAALIARSTGFDGKIVWDTSQPNGQPRRCLDITRAKGFFGFHPQVDLKTGVSRTIEWYRTHACLVQDTATTSP
jgi:GDP-L-fucose synthase